VVMYARRRRSVVLSRHTLHMLTLSLHALLLSDVDVGRVRPWVGMGSATLWWVGRPRTCRDISDGRYTQSDSAGGRTGTVGTPIGVY